LSSPNVAVCVGVVFSKRYSLCWRRLLQTLQFVLMLSSPNGTVCVDVD
jgi:hypothetical protein